MKKSTFIFVFLMIIFGSQVKAQNTLDNLGLSNSTPASVAYSLRKLSSNYSGPLVRILISSSYYDVYPDTTTNQFFSLTSPVSASYSNYNDANTGATATLLSSLITGSTSASVAIWYDQSGNGIDVMTSSTNGPIIINSGAIQTMNGKPTVYFASVSQSTSQLVSSNTVDFTSQTAATINAVVQNVGSINYISGVISTGLSGGWGLNYDPTNSINGYWIDGSGCTNANSGDTSNVSKIVTGIIDQNANTSSIYENKSLKQTRNSICGINHTTTDNICIGIRAANGGVRIFDGYLSEVMIFPSYLSSTNRNSLENNQNVTYFSPSISITSSDTDNSICLGDSVTFTASSYNVNNPTYQWYLNGNAINGATASAFSSTTLANNDTIYVVMDVSGTPLTSNSISTTVSNSSLVTSAIKLSTGASTVTSLTSNLTWAIDNTLNDDNALFQITYGYELSFITPAVYGQNNIYTVSTISGCNRKNITVTISPYCGNWNKGGDGLTQSNPGTSAYQIKSDHPSSVDGLYWISNANINNGTPFQIYADMTTDGGGWTLIMCNNQNSSWDMNTAILRNENSPTINGNYSIISYADYIKKSASGFQYMLDATTRGNWGGIWTANQAYSFVHTSNDQTNVTLDTTFGNWQYNNDGIEQIMPWFYHNGPGLITTSFDPRNNWWGTLITDDRGWTPAPWISNGNPNPGIIWYWVR